MDVVVFTGSSLCSTPNTYAASVLFGQYKMMRSCALDESSLSIGRVKGSRYGHPKFKLGSFLLLSYNPPNTTNTYMCL